MSPTTRGCCGLGASARLCAGHVCGRREFPLGSLTVHVNQKSGCCRWGRGVVMAAVPVRFCFFGPCYGHDMGWGVWIRPSLFLDMGTALGEPPHQPAGASRPWRRRRPRLPPQRPRRAPPPTVSPAPSSKSTAREQ